MGKKILLVVSLVVLCWLPGIEAASTITNTANLVYSDYLGGTYTDAGTCTLTRIMVKVTIKKQARNITSGGTYTDIAKGLSNDVI